MFGGVGNVGIWEHEALDGISACFPFLPFLVHSAQDAEGRLGWADFVHQSWEGVVSRGSYFHPLSHPFFIPSDSL